MIDTVKIYTMIDKNTYDKISNNSIIKASYKKSTKELFYEIVNDKLERFLFFFVISQSTEKVKNISL